MHLSLQIYISAIIQIAIILLLIQSIALLIKSIKKMETKFKKSLLLILCAFLFFAILTGIFIFMVYQKIDYESWLWILPSVIGLFGSFILILGGKKLLETINSPEEE